MKVTYDEKTNSLTIVLPVHAEGTPSKSGGKMMMIGGSGGWRETEAKLKNGKTIRVAINAGYKP